MLDISQFCTGETQILRTGIHTHNYELGSYILSLRQSCINPLA